MLRLLFFFPIDILSCIEAINDVRLNIFWFFFCCFVSLRIVLLSVIFSHNLVCVLPLLWAHLTFIASSFGVFVCDVCECVESECICMHRQCNRNLMRFVLVMCIQTPSIGLLEFASKFVHFIALLGHGRETRHKKKKCPLTILISLCMWFSSVNE